MVAAASAAARRAAAGLGVGTETRGKTGVPRLFFQKSGRLRTVSPASWIELMGLIVRQPGRRIPQRAESGVGPEQDPGRNEASTT